MHYLCQNLQSAILFLASTLNIPTLKKKNIRMMQSMRLNGEDDESEDEEEEGILLFGFQSWGR